MQIRIVRHKGRITQEKLPDAKKAFIDPYIAATRNSLWRWARSRNKSPDSFGDRRRESRRCEDQRFTRGEAGAAKIYWALVGQRVVVLTIFGPDKQIKQLAPAWDLIRTSLKSSIQKRAQPQADAFTKVENHATKKHKRHKADLIGISFAVPSLCLFVAAPCLAQSRDEGRRIWCGCNVLRMRRFRRMGSGWSIRSRRLTKIRMSARSGSRALGLESYPFPTPTPPRRPAPYVDWPEIRSDAAPVVALRLECFEPALVSGQQLHRLSLDARRTGRTLGRQTRQTRTTSSRPDHFHQLLHHLRWRIILVVA